MKSMKELYESVCWNGILVLDSCPDFNPDYETYCEIHDSLTGKVQKRFERVSQMFADCENINRIKMVDYNLKMFAPDPDLDKFFSLLIKREEKLSFLGTGRISRFLLKVLEPKW